MTLYFVPGTNSTGTKCDVIHMGSSDTTKSTSVTRYKKKISRQILLFKFDCYLHINKQISYNDGKLENI
jgi:hypothetical protein